MDVMRMMGLVGVEEVSLDDGDGRHNGDGGDDSMVSVLGEICLTDIVAAGM